jgi:hypothetical protein
VENCNGDGGSQGGTVLAHEIPAQPLPQALAAFAVQTGMQIVYLSDTVRDQHSAGARAGTPAAEALEQLLHSSGLRFEFLNSRTVRIFAVPTAPPNPLPGAHLGAQPTVTNGNPASLTVAKWLL